MKKKGVILLLVAAAAGTAVVLGARAKTIRQTNRVLEHLEEAEDFTREYYEGLDQFSKEWEAYQNSAEWENFKKEMEAKGKATIERNPVPRASGSGVAANTGDPMEDPYEEFTRRLSEFRGDPESISLQILDADGIRVDSESEGFDLAEIELMFLMNDADHDAYFLVTGIPAELSFEEMPIESSQGFCFAPGDYLTEDGEITIRRYDLDGNLEAERTLWLAVNGKEGRES